MRVPRPWSPLRLAVLFDNHIEVVAVIESPDLIKMSQTVGRIIPPHASSLGKALTAFQPEAVQERLPRTESSRKSEFRDIRLRETTI